MSIRISEKKVVDILISYLRKKNCFVAREVKHYEKHIDVVAIPHLSDYIVTYEAKTQNWSCAISQAIVNLSVGQLSYVAMFSEKVHLVDHSLLEEYGVGLVSVGSRWGDVVTIKEPRLSTYLNQLASDRIRKKVLNERKA